MTTNPSSAQFVPSGNANYAGISVRARVEDLRSQAGDSADEGKRTARALECAGALWRRRLETGWTPPEGSPFPWAQVQLSLNALLPGLETAGEWRDRALPAFPQSFPVVALILAGNTPLMAWSPLAACLLAGSTVFVKMSRDETLWPQLFIESLADADPEVAARVVLDVWPGDNPRTNELVQSVDAVVAFGSDATLDVLRAAVPVSTPFFGYGHSLSIGLWRPSNRGDLATDGFARDVLLYGQGGCLSAQHIFVEGGAEPTRIAAEALAVSLASETASLALAAVTDPAVARVVREACDLAHFEGNYVRGDSALRWTVIERLGKEILPPPVGFGVVTVASCETIPQIFTRLGPLRGRVSCVGVAGEVTPELRAMLEAEGVSRLCKPGEMQTPPLDWPNGGFDLITALSAIR